MKEYPFSGMSPERALEFFWTEFRIYKDSTDNKIKELNEQIAYLEEQLLAYNNQERQSELSNMLKDNHQQEISPEIAKAREKALDI